MCGCGDIENVGDVGEHSCFVCHNGYHVWWLKDSWDVKILLSYKLANPQYFYCKGN
jgi:hypothetical protein